MHDTCNFISALASVISFAKGLVVLLVYFVIDVWGVGQSLPTLAAVQGWCELGPT